MKKFPDGCGSDISKKLPLTMTNLLKVFNSAIQFNCNFFLNRNASLKLLLLNMKMIKTGI